MSSQNGSSESAGAIRLTPTMFGCGILVISFFLPWLSILGVNISGVNLHEVWGPGQFTWLIPVIAGGALISAFMGKRDGVLAQIAGGIPFIFLAVGLNQIGPDLMKGLEIGGWGTLLSGLFLLCVAPRLKKGSGAKPIEPPPLQ